MKKVIGLLLCIISVCFIIMPTDVVNARTSITASLNSKVDEIKKGEEVVITLRFSNYEGIKKGINTYKAALKYDREVFETVKISNFKNKSGWENLKFNEKTNEFVAIKKTRTKVDEDVVQITLKARKDVKPQKSIISVVDIVVSEDKNDILLNNASKTIKIVEDKVTTIVNKGDSNKNDQTDKVDKVSSSKSDNNEDSKNSDDEKDTDDDKNLNEDITNNDSDNDNKNNDNRSDEKTQKSGVNSLYLVLVGAIVFVSGTLVGYFVNKSKLVSSQSNVNKDVVNNSGTEDNNTVNNDNIVEDDNDNNNSNNHTENNSSNNIKMLIFLLLSSILLQIVGSNVVQAQSLDLDSDFDYADVDFLQRCLIHLEVLSDSEVKEFDVNGDGKITAADVTLTVQVIEDILDYDVDLFDFSFDNYYPLKGDTVQLSFDSKVAYGAKIEKLVINNQEYNVSTSSSLYSVSLNAGIKAGIKNFHITEAILDNGKTTEIDYVQSVDVLKAMPRVENYVVTENIREQKLIISFDINDKDNSVVNSLFKVFDRESKIVKSQKLVSGRNIVEFDVQDGEKYNTSIEIFYDLDTNKLDYKKDNTGVVKIEKEVTLVTDYKFKLDNIKTYKNNVQNDTFNSDEKIELRFESTNSTKYEPVKVKINGNTYNVEKNNGKYVVMINGFSTSGNKDILIEEVILGNGKLFNLSNNNNISVNIIKVKQKPSVSSLIVTDDKDNLKVQFRLNDLDDTINSAAVVLYNQNDVEIGRQSISVSEIKSGNIVKSFSTSLVSKYKVKIDVTYTLNNHGSVSEVLAEKVYSAPIKAVITDSVSNNIYPAKKDIIMLTYGIETNALVDVYKIRINNTDCMVRKTSDGKYKLIYQVKGTSGIEELVATDIIYKDNTVSKVNNILKVDVLKEKPVVSNIVKTENIEASEVNFEFDIADNDSSIIGAKAILTNLLDKTVVEKTVVNGHNTLNFKIVGGVDYSLDIVYTYDLDTNSLDGYDVNEHRTTEYIIKDEAVHLDVIANIVDDSNLSYNLIDCSIYFKANGTPVLRFRTENDIDLDLCKMNVNGKMYDIVKENNYYIVELYDIDIFQLNSILMRAILGDRDIISIKHNNNIVTESKLDEINDVIIDKIEDVQ